MIELLAKHYHTSKREIRRRLYETGFHSEKFKPFKQTELYNSITDEVNHAEKKANEIHNMNDSFSATLNKLIEAKRESILDEKEVVKRTKSSRLSELSGISDHTLSRMRTKNGENVSLQMILGVCCGLSLSLPETEMLLDKSPFRLQPSIPEHYAYKSVIPLFKLCKISEINTILDKAGVRRIGNAKYE